MQDILVLFKGVPDEQIADPGEQLKKVLDFRAKLNAEKGLYYKVFDDVASLRFEVSTRLQRWALEAKGEISRLVPDQRQTDGKSTDGSPKTYSKESPSAAEALALAEQYEARGLVVQAEAAYAAAVSDGDIESFERYARFLRRTGRLSKSLEVNRRILQTVSTGKSEIDELRVRTRALSNVGIIERKMGHLNNSRSALREAVQTAASGGESLLESMAYALDNLSITLGRTGDEDDAARCLEQALDARRALGDDTGTAHTLTNLGRLYRRTNQLERAREVCAEAIALLDGSVESSALASAHAAMGEIFEMEGDFAGAEEAFRIALRINESLGLPDVIALSLTQLARILINLGELPAAERYAQRSLDENDRASNREGVIASNHLLGRIYGLTGRTDLAISLLERAADDYAEVRNPTGEAWARLHLAKVQKQAGHDHVAQNSLERAQFIASGLRNNSLREQTEESL